MTTEIEIQGKNYEAQVVLNALEPFIKEARISRMRSVLSQRLSSIRLGIEDLHHEHNGAACIRTAEGLGVHCIMAAEPRNQYPIPGDKQEVEHTQKGRIRKGNGIPRSISTSAHRWIDLQRYPTGTALITAAHAEGFKVYGAGPRGQMKLLDIPLDQPLVILFGNEASGLLDETMDQCDGVFQIPMYGFTESFNLSVSAGMVLEQLCARIRAQLWSQGLQGELSADEQLHLLTSWACREFSQRELNALMTRFLT